MENALRIFTPLLSYALLVFFLVKGINGTRDYLKRPKASPSINIIQELVVSSGESLSWVPEAEGFLDMYVPERPPIRAFSNFFCNVTYRGRIDGDEIVCCGVKEHGYVLELSFRYNQVIAWSENGIHRRNVLFTRKDVARRKEEDLHARTILFAVRRLVRATEEV